MKARLAEEWIIFLLAVQFLTRLPTPADPGWNTERMAATPRWYPAVGALVGALSAAVFWLASLVLPPLAAVLLAVAAGVVATGALHEDGFADCCDGLGGAVSRERALEIMRDSRLGAYGALGLGLIIALKVVALAGTAMPVVPFALIAGHALSRASAVVVIATSTYARDEGAGKPVASASGSLPVALGAAALATVPLVVTVPPAGVLAGFLGLAAGHVLMRRAFERRLGGYTGDCLGAVQQLSEVGFYLGLLTAL